MRRPESALIPMGLFMVLAAGAAQAACGDHTIDPGEMCDPPGSTCGPDGAVCQTDCTCFSKGDCSLPPAIGTAQWVFPVGAGVVSTFGQGPWFGNDPRFNQGPALLRATRLTSQAVPNQCINFVVDRSPPYDTWNGVCSVGELQSVNPNINTATLEDFFVANLQHGGPQFAGYRNGSIEQCPTPYGWFYRVDSNGDGVYGDMEAVLLDGSRAPGTPTAISPNGVAITTETPTYVWTPADALAMYYWLTVGTASSQIVDRWYAAQDVCPPGATQCQATSPASLPAGAYGWSIQAWNPDGFSWYSTGASFSVATMTTTTTTTSTSIALTSTTTSPLGGAVTTTTVAHPENGGAATFWPPPGCDLKCQRRVCRSACPSRHHRQCSLECRRSMQRCKHSTGCSHMQLPACSGGPVVLNRRDQKCIDANEGGPATTTTITTTTQPSTSSTSTTLPMSVCPDSLPNSPGIEVTTCTRTRVETRTKDESVTCPTTGLVDPNAAEYDVYVTNDCGHDEAYCLAFQKKDGTFEGGLCEGVSSEPLHTGERNRFVASVCAAAVADYPSTGNGTGVINVHAAPYADISLGYVPTDPAVVARHLACLEWIGDFPCEDSHRPGTGNCLVATPDLPTVR